MISIWDFPNKVYVLLKHEFRKQVFETTFDVTGGRRNLASILGVGYTAVSEWYYGFKKRTKTKITTQRCPVWAYKKIAEILVQNGYENLVLQIEKNISSYSGHSGAEVKNPVLPIKETPELMNLIAHIIGDGSVSKRAMPYFSNTSKELREEFIKDLKILGDTEYKESYRNHVPRVWFPLVVPNILEKAYKIDFVNKKFLNPSFFFSLPDNLICSFLRGIYDDEGYVHDSNIQICSIDEKLLLLIKRLLKKFGILTSNIFAYQDYYRKDGSLSRVLYFDIYSEYIPKFNKLVGFTHPEKREFLEYIVKRINRGWKHPNPESIKITVLSELEKGISTSRRLALKTLITARNLRKNYLYPMEEGNLTVRSGKKKGKGGAQLWSITQKGKMHLKSLGQK